MYTGEKKLTTYYITTEARDTAKTLAAFAGVPVGAFVETVIRRAGPDVAAQLKLERDQDAAGDAVAGGPVAAADVPAGGSPGSED
jgi:hypothetical protein